MTIFPPTPRPPEGPEDLPVYVWTGEVDFDEARIVDAWAAVSGTDPGTGSPIRAYLGRGRLLGTICRERSYDTSGPGEATAYFTIGDDGREARAEDDVHLPIVGCMHVQTGPGSWEETGEFLPAYPRCPDCGGRIEWAEYGGVPGSRRCAGETEPDMHAAGSAASPAGVTSDPSAGCGSRFVDTRYGYASEVPATCATCDGEGGECCDWRGAVYPDPTELQFFECTKTLGQCNRGCFTNL